jgi:hypothetical protein
MNGYVEYYGEGSFQNLCLKAETAARLLPRELWFEFNAVFDYLPLAAVGFPLSLSSATLSLESHHRRTRSFKARSLRFMEVCPADQLGTTCAQVRPRSAVELARLISAMRCRRRRGSRQPSGARPRRSSTGDAAAPVGWRESPR